MTQQSLDFTALKAAYAAGYSPRALVDELEQRIVAYDDQAVFLSRPSRGSIETRAAALAMLDARTRAQLPLFGIPFAVKDNIDVVGLPTTAGCPAFAYTPSDSAVVVARLEAAGAILIGKTNLDQFAAGLVGVRSPYGVPRNPFDAAIIPGGSSSGSATAVAAGLVAFSLGTDTAGSGRIPAGLNNLVGLKPTPGLVSTRGVVPACRTLDCVSIFALTTDDATAVLAQIAGYEPGDPFSRAILPSGAGHRPDRVRLGIPDTHSRHFFGDAAGEAAFDAALKRLAASDFALVPVDFGPLFETARLLYEGPWVAERFAAISDFLASHSSALHPVTLAVIASAQRYSAVDTFKALYRLAELRRAAEAVWLSADALLVPTVPRAWKLTEVAAEPITTNATLGTYTNFVNLLGMAALAIPVALRADGLPFGVTLIGPGGSDAWLASVGRSIEGGAGLPLGATGIARPVAPQQTVVSHPRSISIAVVGAHLTGLPLNHQLIENGGAFVRRVKTAATYRFYALAGGPPARPGLVRVRDGGAMIDAEIWDLPPDGFGRFVASIPAPLGIGTLDLDDGTQVKGFVCEQAGLEGATDITAHGGWRHYLASTKA